MKKFFLFLVSFILSGSLLVSLVGSAEGELSLQDTYWNTGFTETMRKNLRGNFESEVLIEIIKAAIEKGKNIVMNLETVPNTVDSFQIPGYTFIEGKQTYDWISAVDGSSHQCLVSCAVIDCDSFYDSSDLDTYGIKNSADGAYYYFNALNFTITYDNGGLSRYVIFRNPSVSSPFLYQYNTTMEVGSSGWVQRPIWRVDTNGSLINTGIDTGYNMHTPRFNTNSVNDIKCDLVHYIYSDYGDEVRYFNSSFGASQYPSFLDIVCSAISMATNYSNGTQAYNNYTVYPTLFYTSWVTSNVSAVNDLFTNYYVDDSQQVYYYNDDFSSNTVIDSSNVNNYYDNAFNTIIGVELPDLIAALPDLVANLRPSLELSAGDLDTAIHNHFDSMPDIGFQWDPSLDVNNYYDLVLPDDDSGGGGSGGGSWVAPTYPAVNTSVYIPAVVPSYSTYAAVTAPANVLANSKNVLQNGWTFLDVLGLLPLIIPLTIVAILWRFTGE